mmetsp:Transcript_2646/g.6639  ORF Transcript_2646/g.6639 Transcript_2646/m.6639 type:complete len:213 (+) Transcript_2646:307-945(+)
MQVQRLGANSHPCLSIRSSSVSRRSPVSRVLARAHALMRRAPSRVSVQKPWSTSTARELIISSSGSTDSLASCGSGSFRNPAYRLVTLRATRRSSHSTSWSNSGWASSRSSAGWAPPCMRRCSSSRGPLSRNVRYLGWLWSGARPSSPSSTAPPPIVGVRSVMSISALNWESRAITSAPCTATSPGRGTPSCGNSAYSRPKRKPSSRVARLT